jgi:phosphoribosylanthranilate isomerase
MGTLVKICGICDVASAVAAVEAGADLIGFHFCSSPRRITPEQAREIIAALPERPRVVGVFLDQPAEEINAIARQLDLDMVQLHGSEPPGFTAERPFMKVLKVRDGQLADASPWPDPIMLDSWSSDGRGGTGKGWNVDIALALLKSRRVFLAGGLKPQTVGDVVRRYRPYGVDVSSGVESRVRVKDSTLMADFVRQVREADALLDASR